MIAPFAEEIVHGGIYENSIIQNMAMLLGGITNILGIHYVRKVF
jgi:hypothetical protein